ncbi:MAG TPA: SufD family Fe-S cluster assembly protein, partial [Steroidobacteraceae bacterium]|nr:SufD family Fe-S cluster assembly protein [Steroidobacteraceae bacterium]
MNVAAKRAVEPALERFAARWRDRRRAAPGVADLQRRALDVAVAAGLPGARNEAFKYTSLRRFGTRTFELPAPGPLLTADELDSRLLPASGWHRLVFIDGHYLPELSTPFPAARGVSVRALADVAITEPDGLADWLERDTGSETPFFAALNAAFIEDGLVIELEASAAIAEPVYVVHVSTARERATMSHTRVILDAGPHTRAILVEHHVAIGAAECYSNVVTDVQLGEHARIEHYRIQEESTAAFHFAQLRAVLADGAGLVDHRIALGAGLDRTDIAVRLDGPGAEVFLNGLFVV